MRIPAFLATIFVCFLHLVPDASAAPVAAGTLAFHLTTAGGIVVPLIVNGIGPVSFLLDTGASGSSISEELAVRVNAPVVATTHLSSSVGQVVRRVARVDGLQLGEKEAAGVLATIAPAGELEGLGTSGDGGRIEGVVGQDVLGALRYTIDYRARRIVWRDASACAPAGASVLALEAHDERFLVVLPQKRTTLRLVPDSGSEALVLFEGPTTRESGVTTLADRVEVSGLAGKASAMLARVGMLQVGSTTLTNVRAVVVARSAAEAAADGLLPLHLFSRVTFNGPERQLIVEP